MNGAPRVWVGFYVWATRHPKYGLGFMCMGHPPVTVVVQDNMGMINLIVRTNSQSYSTDPADFRSSDRCAAVLRAFCNSRFIPYEDVFVSIAVKVKKQSMVKAVGRRTTHGIDEAFGKFAIELDERVIEHIQVATIGDFQTVVCKAIALECSSASDDTLVRYLQDKVHCLQDMSPQEKKRKLEEMSTKLPSNRYCEARIFRTLHTSDKKTKLLRH
jgi:hypothetical protein